MKFSITVSNGTSEWQEEYDKDEVTDTKSAKIFGKQLVADFNASMRPGEKARKLMGTEIIGPSEFVTCGDCGARHKEGMPHAMFCEAHTCDECGTSFSRVLDKDEDDRRLCEDCEFSD